MDIPPCPKCGAAYIDSGRSWDHEHPGSYVDYDIFECGSKDFGITLGIHQSKICRNGELTNVLKAVRRALTHKHNAREIALIDAAIDPQEEAQCNY